MFKADYKLQNKPIRALFIVTLVIILSSCGGYESEVKIFKSSSAYADLSKCLGLENVITIIGFNPVELASEDTLVMQANFSKKNEKFVSQWIYSKYSKDSELVFLGKDGSDESIMAGNNFANLCGESNSGSKLPQNLQFRNDTRRNKKYGLALAQFGFTDQAKNHTIKLSNEINKLKIENSRPVQLVEGNYGVITTNLENEYSTLHNLTADNLGSEFSKKGMNLMIERIIVLRPFKENK